jgi:nitrate/nitrite transport system ATP-binding protein
VNKPFLCVQNLKKTYPASGPGRPLVVFDEVNFGANQGEIVSIIGHSGCGKSTILSIIAGLYVAGEPVRKPGLSRGMVFQNHSLLPWRTALGNVMFSVRARHPEWSHAQLLEHSRQFLRLVGLSHAEDRKPAQLSGGMRQRVGIARAFAIEPQILLMDEPFGALDALTRASIQDQLLELWRRTRQTIVLITHDVDEALYLSDHVLVMGDGPDARIVERLRVDLDRPRERERLLRDTRYHELRAHLLGLLASNGRARISSTQPLSIPAKKLTKTA